MFTIKASLAIIAILMFSAPTVFADPFSKRTEAVQQVLRYKGYAIRQIDGVWGEQTTQALKAYQRKMGIEATGELDAATLGFLTKDAKAYDAANAVRATTSSSHRQSAGCINPATGLPTVSGECWGVDVGGNPYGMNNSSMMGMPGSGFGSY